jgi:putative flippase GtrA
MFAKLLRSDIAPVTPLANSSATGLRLQIIRFAVIGGLSVAIDGLVYVMLHARLGHNQGKAISYIVGMIFGFFGNKFWTFESTQKSAREPILYAMFYLFTLTVNVVLNSACLDWITRSGAQENVSQALAFLIATGTTTILNFLGLKYIAFRRSGPAT